MINPTQITNFERTDRELQLFWIFCILVAGKNSDVAARKVGSLFKNLGDQTPFEYLNENKHAIHNLLVANRVGQYNRIESALTQSLELDLRSATLEDLMKIKGVGPKTARFFLLHSRHDCEHVILDVHILRYLRTRWQMDVPINTPPPVEYNRIEKLAANLIKSDFPNLSMAEADLLIWANGSGRLEESPFFP
jgi:thermostable 8-oxoguanine DNA glycosylase